MMDDFPGRDTTKDDTGAAKCASQSSRPSWRSGSFRCGLEGGSVARPWYTYMFMFMFQNTYVYINCV